MRLLRVALLAPAVAAVTACGGSDKGTSPAPNPTPPGFSVTLSNTTLAVEQGSTGSITATIGRTGSFSGTVNLGTENVPAGVTATFNPAAITSGTTSTTLTVGVAPTVAPGAYTFTIRGQASGLTDQSATVSMTVTARPAISMVLSPLAATVQAGASTSFAATISRTNFTGAVSVGVTGAPAGVTTAVAVAGDVHTVTVTVGAAVPAGTYALVATATGSGVASVSASFALTVTAPPLGSIALTASPTIVTLEPGGASQGTTITITRTNFAGNVTTTAPSGLPPGVTVTFNPAGPTTANTVTATFVAAATTVQGNYNVVLQGSGTGATPGTTAITVTVSGGPFGNIALSANPSTVSVQQGATGGTTLAITRTNVSTPVTLTSSGAPAGVVVTFGASPTTQATASINFNVGASVPAGTYPIVVTASAVGAANASTTVTLIVTPAPPSSGNVTFTFCGAAASIPIWLAAQNAFGAWAPVTGINNTYSFNINTIGGVAWVTQNASNSYQLTIVYGTVTELAARGSSTCTSPTPRSVTGTAAGFGAADLVTVSVGSAVASPAPTLAAPNFTIDGVAPGLVDLLATRSALNLANPANLISLTKVFLKRGLNPANGSSIGTVDFNSASDAFDPDSKQLTVFGGLPGETVSASAAFFTSNLGFASLGATTGSSTLNYSAIPAARTAAGDVHAISGFATTTSGSLVASSRVVTTVFRDATNTTITLGSLLNTPSVSTVATAPYARLRAQLTRQGDYDNAWSAAFSQSGRSVVISMSSTYIAQAGAFDVTVPDYAALAGWQNTWGLQPGTSTVWTVSATGWVVGNGTNAEGSITRSASRQGVITP